MTMKTRYEKDKKGITTDATIAHYRFTKTRQSPKPEPKVSEREQVLNVLADYAISHDLATEEEVLAHYGVKIYAKQKE